MTDRLYNGIHTPLKKDEYEACPHCGMEVSHLCPDALSFCDNCDVMVEGSTIIKTCEFEIPVPSDLASRYFIRED